MKERSEKGEEAEEKDLKLQITTIKINKNSL